MPFLFIYLRMNMNQIVDVTPNTLTSTPALITYSRKDLKDMFHELHASYQNAETWAKRVENVIDDVPIAAINQMRYAGYHISKVLSKSEFFPRDKPNDCLVNIDDLRSAYKHLLRAYFDSLDQLTQQLEAQLKDYESKFQDLNLVVTDHFPEFFTWVESVNEIGQFDISSNTEAVNRFAISKNDRDTHYSKIADKINDLETIQKQFRAIANCLVVQAKRITKEENALVEAQRTARISKNWTIAAVIVAVISVIVALFFGIKSMNSTSQAKSSVKSIITQNSPVIMEAKK